MMQLDAYKHISRSFLTDEISIAFQVPFTAFTNMPGKRFHTIVVTPAPPKPNHPEKHQVTSSDFSTTDQVIAKNTPSPSTFIARFLDGDLRDIKLSKVRLGRFKVNFRGLDSAVTTIVLLEHDFHIKKEVSLRRSSLLTLFRSPPGLKKPPLTPS